MNEKFFDLKKEKQDRMVGAVLKVFAKYGYEAAGTDEMVREAAVSKGLLFHYFGSKLGAYAFAYDYAARFLDLELGKTLLATERDPIRLVQQAEEAVARVMHSYPYVQLFLYRAREEDSVDARAETQGQRAQVARMQAEIRGQADFSGYRMDIPPERIWRAMDYLVRGVLEEALRSPQFTPEHFLSEVNAQLELLALAVRRIGGVSAL